MSVPIKLSFEEKLKYHLVPSFLYARHIRSKEHQKGDPEVHLLKFLVNPEKISLDIGANKGSYTLPLSDFSQKVLAFEPHPKAIRFLKKILPQNTTLYPYALSNHRGNGEFRIPLGRKKTLSNQGGSLSTVKVSKDYMAHNVICETLDNLNLYNIGFIKIDVEGFEKEVLMGGKNLIQKEKPTLLIKIEERHT